MPRLAGTAIVLAGGRSRRLGTDKALVRIGRMRLIERVVGVVDGLFRETLIVARDPRRYAFLKGGRVRIAADRFREPHALGGIYSGLAGARTRHCFVTSCDQPYLQPRLIRALWKERSGHDAVVPRHGGRLQPLCAVYSRACMRPILRRIRRGDLRVSDLVEAVRARISPEAVKRADPKGRSFMDVDTRADLARARKIAG